VLGEELTPGRERRPVSGLPSVGQQLCAGTAARQVVADRFSLHVVVDDHVTLCHTAGYFGLQCLALAMAFRYERAVMVRRGRGRAPQGERPTKEARLNLRIPVDLLAEVAQRAAREERTVSQLVRILLRQALQER
jgi:hypothetical protein